jgi:hypothetical protein
MGATVQTIQLRGVSGAVYQLSAYFAGGDAIGYIVPTTFNGAASATSGKDFVLPEPCRIENVTGPATGTFTIDANGMPTPININTASVIAMVARAGVTYGNLKAFNGNAAIRYSLRVTVAMAA